MLDHVAIQVRDVAATAAFYDAVLAPLGAARTGAGGDLIAFGTTGHTFRIGPAGGATVPGPAHLAFVAPDRAAVHAFHAAAVVSGAESLDAPRLRPEHHPTYFAARVRDPEGNRIEAVCHGPS